MFAYFKWFAVDCFLFRSMVVYWLALLPYNLEGQVQFLVPFYEEFPCESFLLAP